MADPLAEPARIAFAGDWHQNTYYAEEAIAYAKERGADVIVHLGDFGYNFTRPFVDGVTAALAHAGLHLLFVDGNHENFPLLHRYPLRDNGLRELTGPLWHLPRGLRWQWSGVRFLAMGGAHSVDRPYREPGVSWWKEETITAEQLAAGVEGGPADVLVSHDCPTGVVIPTIDDRTTLPPFPPLEIMRSDEHRQVLRKLVDAVRPAAIWHGHYHHRYQATADLGYGDVVVNGLHCDGGELTDNVAVVDLDDLCSPTASRPEVGSGG